jgi:hypothetical protein
VRHNQNRGEFSHVDQRLQEGWYLHDVISITGRESFVDQNRTTWAYHRSQLDPDPIAIMNCWKPEALDSYSASRHYTKPFDYVAFHYRMNFDGVVDGRDRSIDPLA